MQIILLISTLSSILFLTIYGAGIFAWTVFIAAIPLTPAAPVTAKLLIIKSQQEQTNTDPEQTGTSTEHHSSSSVYRSSFILHRYLPLPLIHIAILSFILLTLIPLPKPLTIVTGPNRYKQNTAVAELLHKSEELKITKPHIKLFSTTRNRAGTMRALLLLAAIYGAFEAIRLLSNRNRMIYMHAMIFIGTAVAIAGYLSCTVYPQGNRLWWLFQVTPFHRPPVGSFLNLNHYAGFIAMLSIAALGTAITNIRTKHPILAALTATASLTMAAFVVISASRGAILALGAGLLAIAASVIFTLKGRLRLIASLAVTAAIICTATIAVMTPKARQRLSTLSHPLTDYSLRPRLCAWQGALKVWTHYPIAGAGANAFRFTYSQYKDKQFRSYRRFAENEPLHILAEGGIIGIILSALLLLSIATRLIHPTQQAPPGSDSPHLSLAVHPLSLAAAAVLITGLTHASVDFIIHLPLYSITIATIIAAGLPPAANRKHLKTALAITLLISFGLMPLTKPLSKYDTGGYAVTDSNDRLAKLLTWSPTNPQILRRLAANCTRLNTRPAKELAEEFITLAAQYDPNDMDIWIQLGNIRLKCGNKPGAKEAFKKAKSIRSWAPIPKTE